jgi:NADP-dependent 3-hydroxy acid dehydrogenase YdfG
MQRTALVTGASSGIGAATAVKLAEAGYRVVLTARRTDRLEAVANQIRQGGGQAEARRLDVTDRPAVDALAESLEQCDVFISNAGGAIGADTVENSDPADWLTMYEVNVLGTLHMTQALLPKLVASGDGTIVVLSSTARAEAGTSPPSTGNMRSPPPCASSCPASRFGSSRSRRAW